MMPMPPTISEMLAIADSSSVITSVVPCAAFASSAWLRTAKSSGSLGARPCASRRMARASACALAMSWGVNVLARICGMNVRPASRVCTVVYGARTTSSWSAPSAVCPLGASTPTIVNGTSRRRICCPTASPSGKRFSATVRPSTATLRVALRSDASKNAPDSSGQSRIVT